MIKHISDLKKKDIIDFITTAINNFGLRLVFVFELKTGDVVGIYDVSTITVPDEVNKKVLDIKGRNISDVIEKFQNIPVMNWQMNYKDEINKVPPINIGYSENMFGFVTFGMQGY